MDRLRLLFQCALSSIARPLGVNHLLTQYCDRCGRTNWPTGWWDDSTEVWEAVAGNVNGHHHGCFCLNCFTIMAAEKNIQIMWRPVIERHTSA